MGSVVGTMMHVPPGWVYGLAALLVFAEAALFVGFVFPGESSVVIGGVLASQGRVELAWLIPIIIVSAIVGDSVGYEVGHRLGPRLLNVRVLRRHRAGVEKAQDLIRRRGAWAVFLGRWLAVLRALMPALAGSSRLPYRKFLLFNALGGIAWSVCFILVGYLAGAAYKKVEHMIGTGSAIAFAAVVVVGVTVWSIRRKRREHKEEQTYEEESAEA